MGDLLLEMTRKQKIFPQFSIYNSGIGASTPKKVYNDLYVLADIKTITFKYYTILSLRVKILFTENIYFYFLK